MNEGLQHFVLSPLKVSAGLLALEAHEIDPLLQILASLDLAQKIWFLYHPKIHLNCNPVIREKVDNGCGLQEALHFMC